MLGAALAAASGCATPTERAAGGAAQALPESPVPADEVGPPPRVVLENTDPEVAELLAGLLDQAEAEPASAERRAALGMAYDVNGLPGAAAKAYRQALDLDPAEPRWVYYLAQVLVDRNPASLKVCALLNRSELRLVEIPIKYVGFQVNDEFLIGYGLDFRGGYRDLPFVATLNPQSVDPTDLSVQTPQ